MKIENIFTKQSLNILDYNVLNGVCVCGGWCAMYGTGSKIIVSCPNGVGNTRESVRYHGK